MKYVKILGLLAVAAAAQMAFTGTALAVLTPGTSPIHAKSSGATSTTGTLTLTCQKSTLGSNEVNPNSPDHARLPLSTLEFSECGNHTVTVTAKPILTITDAGAESTTGTVSMAGSAMTVLYHFFLLGTVHCTYVTSHANPTQIGTFTESDHDPDGGGPLPSHSTATLDITATISKDPLTSDGACGDHATWEGKYEFTSPDHLTID